MICLEVFWESRSVRLRFLRSFEHDQFRLLFSGHSRRRLITTPPESGQMTPRKVPPLLPRGSLSLSLCPSLLLPPPPHPIIAGRENGNQLHGGGVAATGCGTDDLIGLDDEQNL